MKTAFNRVEQQLLIGYGRAKIAPRQVFQETESRAARRSRDAQASFRAWTPAVHCSSDAAETRVIPTIYA